MDAHFKKVEDEYFRLKGKLALGHITRDELKAALKELMVEDAEGRYWSIGADSGKWHVYENKSWVEGDPAGVRIGSLSAQEPRSDVQKSAGRRFALAMSGAILLIFIGLLILGGLILTTSVNIFQTSLLNTATRIAVDATAEATAVNTASFPTTIAANAPSPAVTRSDTPSPPVTGPALGPIACSSGFDEATQTPIGVRADAVIPLGATRFFVSWPYRGVDPNETYSYYWQYGGQQYFAGLHKFPKPTGVGSLFIGGDTQRLTAQTYHFEIRIGTKTIAAHDCVVR